MTDETTNETITVNMPDNTRGSKLSQAVREATARGHKLRDTLENEPVAPGVFAVCTECTATIRYHNRVLTGEAVFTWCPDSVAKLVDLPTKIKEPVDFVTLNAWQEEIHAYALDKGWWYEDDRNPPPRFDAKLVLVHSELSEALEEWRNNHDEDEVYYVKDKDGIDKPEGIPIELADAIIRILDMAGYWKIDIQKAIAIKHAYNLTRSYRHGGKRS